MIILGIDPGLNYTGWGIINNKASSIEYIASGVISPSAKLPTSQRLHQIYTSLKDVITKHNPEVVSLEETFVNKDPKGALKLGYSRGIALMIPSIFILEVFEYAPNTIKKTVCGNGHASKEQLQAMLKLIFPKVQFSKNDESDAVAIALCHAYHGIKKYH